MIYLFLGTDEGVARKKAHILVASLLKKKPDANYFKFDELNWDASLFDEYIRSQTLFNQKYIVYLNKVFENKDAKQYILGNIKEIEESEHIFIFIEKKLLDKELKKFEKYSTKIQNIPSSQKIETYTNKERKYREYIFTITDAVGEKNRKKAWTQFTKALYYGVSADTVYPMIFWQIKSIQLANETQSPSESGLKPFVYNKGKVFSKNYKRSEILNKSDDLISILYNVRTGATNFEDSLESYLLAL